MNFSLFIFLIKKLGVPAEEHAALVDNLDDFKLRVCSAYFVNVETFVSLQEYFALQIFKW
jgi:hypothetical protein